MRIISVLLLTTLFALAANAQVYRWVDDNGKVHYTDTPPPGEKPQPVDIDTNTSKAEPEAEAAASNDTDAVEDPSAQALAEKRCELAKLTLANYRGAETLVKTDAEGNKQPLSEKEKTAAIKQAEATVAERCAKSN